MKNKRKFISALCLSLTVAMLFPMTAMAASRNELNGDSEETVVAEAQGLSTYTARIMQGNTNEEDDCRATENGLLDSGSYTTTSIVETGWTYTNRTTSSINTTRATATNFRYSNLYQFAYFSGHGSKSSGVPTLNATPSNSSSASGTYTSFNVAQTLGVDSSNWRTASYWSSSDSLRVLILAACHQLDSTIMHYYARAMRASNVRAIAGYHESGPGHSTDVTIANSFFNYANAGNSVKYSWQYFIHRCDMHRLQELLAQLSDEDREFLLDCFNYEADYIKRLSKKYDMTGAAVRWKKAKMLEELRRKFFE